MFDVQFYGFGGRWVLLLTCVHLTLFCSEFWGKELLLWGWDLITFFCWRGGLSIRQRRFLRVLSWLELRAHSCCLRIETEMLIFEYILARVSMVQNVTWVRALNNHGLVKRLKLVRALQNALVSCSEALITFHVFGFVCEGCSIDWLPFLVKRVSLLCVDKV